MSPNFVEWLSELGVKATPVGVEMRYRRSGAASSAPATAPTAEQLISDQFDAVGSAAKGCDVLLGAGGHQYAARSIGEASGISYVNAVYAPVSLPSPNHAPPPTLGQAWEVGQPADNQQRWLDNAKVWNDRALEPINRHRGRLGLRPVDDVHAHSSAPITRGSPPTPPWRHFPAHPQWRMDPYRLQAVAARAGGLPLGR